MVLLLVACSSEPDLVRQHTSFGKFEGVAMHPEGWTGSRVGMYGTTCEFTSSGEIGAEYNFGLGSEHVLDSDGGQIVVMVDDTALVQTADGGWLPGFDEHRVPGIVDARLFEREVVALSREDGECRLVWTEQGVGAPVPCGRMVELPEGPTTVTALNPLWTRAAWDQTLERLIATDGELVFEVDEAGEPLWSYDPGATVHDVVGTARGVAMSVEYSDGTGAMLLVEDGVLLDTIDLRWPGERLNASDDGWYLALERDFSMIFVRVD